MLTDNYRVLQQKLRAFIPEQRIFSDELRTLAYGTDAGFYRLIPKLVVRVEGEEEVVRLLAATKALHLSVTFRAAGTSLSGQSVSDSVLMMLGPSWNRYRISSDALQISLQPGIVGARANALLARFGRKIGPDPASINAAMIGGIAANNASGMCCGTAQNSYRTVSSMKIILADGTFLDTADPESRNRFCSVKADLVSDVLRIAKAINTNAALAERVRRKFRMKNTTGYSLNAFVDFADPIDIIQHLMIGSEGTLGFIAEITYNTVPELADKASSLMLFPDIHTACKAVEVLKHSPVDAVELMDRVSLRSVENKSGMPPILKSLGDDAASLLVETRATSNDHLARQITEIRGALTSLPTIGEIAFTAVASEYATLWNIRKGLFPSVGAMRATGTTCIIEDVCFPIARLAEAILDLRSLFQKHGYQEAIIFGHALEGNIHFVFNQNFNIPAEVERYRSFVDDVTHMVVNTYDGSLKAEHGTGRNMAPFVELEWGAEAYQLMKEVKRAFDPDNLLNPGVILNPDREAHVKNLKPLPEADPIVDKCIECGFCEVQCPSKNLTLTPRQRIVSYREMARLGLSNAEGARLSRIAKAYRYFGDETCATDGLCALACPVEIDTGKLTKALRSRALSPFSSTLASLIANNMRTVTAGMRGVLNALNIVHGLLGPRLLMAGSSLLRTLSGNRSPLWNRYMPKGADRIRRSDDSGGDSPVVYFPTCINRTMGISRDYEEQRSVTSATEALLRKAGYRVVYPDNLANLCCGMAFDSKGFKQQGLKKAHELEATLLKASHDGEFPVYVDMSPCLYRMKETLDSRLHLYEPIEFALKFLVERLNFKPMNTTIVIHTTCSSTKMGLSEDFKRLASMCAETVVVPDGVGCCGWAGDRGFTVPELNASALQNLRQGIPAGCSHGYSTSRTCEIGLSLHSGISYTSIVYLIDQCTELRFSHHS